MAMTSWTAWTHSKRLKRIQKKRAKPCTFSWIHHRKLHLQRRTCQWRANPVVSHRSIPFPSHISRSTQRVQKKTMGCWYINQQPITPVVDVGICCYWQLSCPSLCCHRHYCLCSLHLLRNWTPCWRGLSVLLWRCPWCIVMPPRAITKCWTTVTMSSMDIRSNEYW